MIKYSSQFGNLTKQRNVERAVESWTPPARKKKKKKKMRQANECDSEGVSSLRENPGKRHTRTRREELMWSRS